MKSKYTWAQEEKAVDLLHGKLRAGGDVVVVFGFVLILLLV